MQGWQQPAQYAILSQTIYTVYEHHPPTIDPNFNGLVLHSKSEGVVLSEARAENHLTLAHCQHSPRVGGWSSVDQPGAPAHRQ